MKRRPNQQKLVEAFNCKYPVGTAVEYWNLPWSERKRSKTRTPAQLLSGHTAVVWLEGESSCWALSHVEVVR